MCSTALPPPPESSQSHHACTERVREETAAREKRRGGGGRRKIFLVSRRRRFPFLHSALKSPSSSLSIRLSPPEMKRGRGRGGMKREGEVEGMPVRGKGGGERASLQCPRGFFFLGGGEEGPDKTHGVAIDAPPPSSHRDHAPIPFFRSICPPSSPVRSPFWVLDTKGPLSSFNSDWENDIPSPLVPIPFHCYSFSLTLDRASEKILPSIPSAAAAKG